MGARQRRHDDAVAAHLAEPDVVDPPAHVSHAAVQRARHDHVVDREPDALPCAHQLDRRQVDHLVRALNGADGRLLEAIGVRRGEEAWPHLTTVSRCSSSPGVQIRQMLIPAPAPAVLVAAGHAEASAV